MAKEKKAKLYTIFINEENVATSTRRVVTSYNVCSNFFYVLSIIPSILATFFGALGSWEAIAAKVSCIIMISFGSVALINFLVLIILEYKHRFFLKLRYFWLFNLGFLLIAILSCIPPIFLNEYYYEEMVYTVNFNPLPFLLGSLPIYVIYYIISYKMYMECIDTYAKVKNRLNVDPKILS